MHGARVRISACYLLSVSVLGILTGSESLLVEQLALCHQYVVCMQLAFELRQPSLNTALRYFYLQVVVVPLSAAFRHWMTAQIPTCVADLNQLECDG